MTLSERIYLAQELHDGIAQDLVGLGYSLDLLLAAPETPTKTRIVIRTMRFTLSDILNKVRNEIHQLRTDTDHSLAEQIQMSAESICADFALKFAIEEVPIGSESDIAYQILQIAREIFRNIATHSAGQSVRVDLGIFDGNLILTISDDGRGGATQTTNRFGIVGARTRAASIGGALRIDSTDSGTQAELNLPMQKLLRI